MNVLTKFHEDWTVNVAYSVKNAPPLGSDTNLPTKFHEDLTMNVALREKCPAPGGHVLKATKTIFELIQDIIGTNLLTSRVLTRKNAPPPWWPYIIGMILLTEFHEDWTINVASRVKNAPPVGSNVFQANVIIFEQFQDINKTNLLTKFHEDWTINVASRFHEDLKNVASRLFTRKNALPPGDHVF
ncbi:hypothetical protein DPMN_087641 [Dreissena polymorpha]|uniref:Uncharacterized protein n=1 Tax=Dreissena polymorpha TaxID=45954 RepID=A0A9D4KT20_DREPO|nr:hypothetical protein DPMN_087641 [Dreissena polymorpha]